jgi:ABC-type sugar transport system substrate-binding protein
VALAPIDSAGVVPIVQRASAGGTPFVTIDWTSPRIMEGWDQSVMRPEAW